MIIWPAQCQCGHIFLERYQFTKPTPKGHIGFCWCGFCRTKLMVKELIIKETDNEKNRRNPTP